jgi:hypothetical protein
MPIFMKAAGYSVPISNGVKYLESCKWSHKGVGKAVSTYSKEFSKVGRFLHKAPAGMETPVLLRQRQELVNFSIGVVAKV